MKIVFVTNYFNHHQKPVADALYSLIGEDYAFICTSEMSYERKKLGYGEEIVPPYVRYTYKTDSEKEECCRFIDDADVVIHGSAPYSLIESRLKKGKLTFLYTERIYRTGVPILKLPIHFLRALKNYIRYKKFYVLCASAYTPVDFSRILSFMGKTYKWGYFTELKKYDDVDALIECKDHHKISWVSRYIPLKHPEILLDIAKRLQNDGYSFEIEMIGTGPLEEEIRRQIDEMEISDCVRMLGSMKPEQVREHMEQSEIFLFTSDRNEGWGAVLNESMNSACAVVANCAIGSVPFMLKDGENGYMYKDGDVEDLYNKVKLLLDNNEERRRMARNAYLTMVNEWNAENAAGKFVALCEKMLSGEYKPFPYESGVCSKAEILKDNWYK